MSEHLSEIRSFVARHVNGAELADDTDIFATGHVNSLFAVQLVMWVERTFGVAAQGSDLDITNFRTIGDIDHFVSGKLASADHEVVTVS